MARKTFSKTKKTVSKQVRSRASGKSTLRKSPPAMRGLKGAVRSKIRSLGNSRGVILSSQVLQQAGLADDADILVTAQEGQIIITELKESQEVNTDLSSWEQQFKQAIKKGAQPEKDLFEGISNEFDQNEWT